LEGCSLGKVRTKINTTIGTLPPYLWKGAP
jgi:hypothetical protein